MTQPPWPPKEGRKYVKSDEFGRLVVNEVQKLGATYPSLDLADAVAITFHWFNSKLNANRSFISKKRFATENRFRAYVRQMLYNAGLRARRMRKDKYDLSAVPEHEVVIDTPSSTVQRKEQFLKLVDQLQEPHKSVFSRYFFDETPLYIIAGSMGLTEEEVHKLYTEAVDQIQKFAN